MERVTHLSRANWVIVASFLLVVFPLIVLLTFMPTVANWYAVTTLAPSLQRDLGFKAEVGRHPAFSQRDTFFITAVNPEGAFGRAGIRPGDIPMDIRHGTRDFYELLESHRGQAVELRFIRISSGPSDTFPVEHRFTVIVPRHSV